MKGLALGSDLDLVGVVVVGEGTESLPDKSCCRGIAVRLAIVVKLNPKMERKPYWKIVAMNLNSLDPF